MQLLLRRNQVGDGIACHGMTAAEYETEFNKYIEQGYGLRGEVAILMEGVQSML